MKLHKAFLLGTMISLGLAAALGIVALLGAQGRATDKIILSVLSFGYFSLASMACAYAIERRRMVAIAWTGIAWSWLAFVLAILIIWFDPWLHRVVPTSHEEDMCLTGFYMSFFAAHMCLLWLATRVEKWSRLLRWVATLSAIALALMFVDGVFKITPAVHWRQNWHERIGGAFAIVTGCTSILFPILLRIEKLQRRDSITTTELEIHVHCPRCGLEQTMTSGHSRCARCRLHYTIEIEEPTCAKCGYVLYKPSGAACPECGHPIPEADRWVIPATEPAATV